METSGGQSSPDAMHSDVLAYSGASSLGAMWVQGSPWVSLGGPLGVLGGSFWIRCGRPMRQTLHTPTFQRLVFFVCFRSSFFSSFLFFDVFRFFVYTNTIVVFYSCFSAFRSVFTGAIRLHAARNSAGTSATQRHLGASQSSKLSQGEYKVLDLLYLSIYLSIYLSVYLPIYLSIYLSIYLYIYTHTYIHIHLYIVNLGPDDGDLELEMLVA